VAGGFDDVLRANEAYAGGFSLQGLEGRAAKRLAVLTCIDSRIEPLTMLGLRPGDAKILRNAGARLTDDVMRALVLSAHLLDVDRLMIVAHTDCRLTAESDDALRDAIAASGGPDTGALDFLSVPDVEAALRADVRQAQASPYLRDVEVGGFVYDVESGRLRHVPTD